MKRALLVGACAALALAACQKQSAAVTASDAATTSDAAAAPAPDAAASSTASPVAAAPSASDFVAKAAASDMYEIQAAKIAEKRSKNADIVNFAKTMVTDHTKSTAMVKKAIADSGRTELKPPADLPADKKAMIDALNSASAAEFDKTYLDQQTMAHQDALALMTAESQSGDVPQLKDAAGMILPVVQMHVDMLAKMTAK
jgi:putative membrane protein